MAAYEYAIVFNVDSWNYLNSMINYTSISDELEDYERCVAREKALEIEACKKLDVPYYYLIRTKKREFTFTDKDEQIEGYQYQ